MFETQKRNHSIPSRRSLIAVGMVATLAALAPPAAAGKGGGPGGGGSGGGSKSYVDLAISMTDSPDPVMEGRELAYGILLENKGTATATGVIMRDPLNAQVTSVNPGGECDRTVTCSLGEIPAGQSRYVYVTVVADADYPTNTATVTSSQPDRASGNNSVTVQTTIQSSIDLAVDVTAFPDPYVAAVDVADGTTDGFTYLVSVTNLSDTATQNVQANLSWLRRELVVRETSSSPASCGPIGPSPFEVFDETICVIPTLEPDQSVEIVVRAEACLPNEGQARLYAWVGYLGGYPDVDYPENDPDWDNNNASAGNLVVGGTNTSCPS